MFYIRKYYYFGLIASILFACQNTSKKEHNTSDDQVNEVSYAKPDIDHGTLQSPINILTDQSEVGKPHIQINFDGSIDEIENLGHTIQLDFKPGTDIKYEDSVYEFVQLHFHTPSEHLIDGITYPMEMHMVNQLKSTSSKNAEEYLVIGVLFKMGSTNQFVEEFINLIPEHEHDHIKVSEDLVHLQDMFEKPLIPKETNFFHYKGSLTTPPYTESVNWFVLKEILTASPEEIQTLNDLEGNNARHIQSLFGREITLE